MFPVPKQKKGNSYLDDDEIGECSEDEVEVVNLDDDDDDDDEDDNNDTKRAKRSLSKKRALYRSMSKISLTDKTLVEISNQIRSTDENLINSASKQAKFSLEVYKLISLILKI